MKEQPTADHQVRVPLQVPPRAIPTPLDEPRGDGQGQAGSDPGEGTRRAPEEPAPHAEDHQQDEEMCIRDSGDPDVATAVRVRRQEMSARVRLPEGFDVSGGALEA